jgi:heme A synthase
LLAIALLVVSFFAHVPRGVRWAGALFGLVVLQVMLAYVAFGAAVVGLLHGVNALALFATAVLAGRRVMRAVDTPAPAHPSTAESVMERT